MKRSITILLVLALILALSACGGGSTTTNTPAASVVTENTPEPAETETPATQEPSPEPSVDIHSIGEEVASEYFPFTLTDVKFSSRILKNGSGDDFITTTDSGDLTKIVSAGNDRQWLYYSVEYKYSGKNSMSSVSSLFRPKVEYLDDTFDSDYFIFLRINGGKWYILSNDNSTVGNPLLKNLSEISGSVLKYEPLSSDTYEVRGIIKLPTMAIEDTENPLILCLYHCEDCTSQGVMMETVRFNVR